MSFDLKGLTTRELDSLIAQAKKQQAALNKRKPIALVRKKLTALAKAEGYTVAELFGGAKAAPAKKAAKSAGKTGRKVAPKYRNPSNPKETWSGRGKQPRWLAEQVKKGKKAEDFLIRK
ncbi:MAG: H-NS family nucleoid-associated regulatory protein [Pseudomonadota bacterium]